MQRQQCKTSRNIKNQGNWISSKEHNNFPVTDLKDMENWDFPHKEFKIIVLRKLHELLGNRKSSTKSGIQYMDKMRSVKEVKIIKEKQILKLKNTVNGDTWNRKNQQPIKQAEGEIYEVEDRSFEITDKRITKKKWKWWMNEKEWRRWRRLTWTVRHYEEKQPSIMSYRRRWDRERGRKLI